LKCAYHPLEEAEERCTVCNITLCKNCHADSQLNDGMCHSCRRQQKISKIYTYIRYSVWGVGITWVIISLFIFTNVESWLDKILIGSTGIAGAILVNFIFAFILSRMLISDLKPHQKLFVALSRYSITGNKVFFNQAVSSMKKVDDIKLYQDALIDHIVSIIILQPHDFPSDWLGYLSEQFHFTEEELLAGIVEFGIDVFENNIFIQHHYQALESYIDILNRTNNEELYNHLVDRIIQEIQKIDLKAVNKPSPVRIPGVDPTQQPQREEPSTIRHRALLTELKLLDSELEEFMEKVNRQADFKIIKDIIDPFELPSVPKNTLAAARSLAFQTQDQPRGPDGIPGTVDDVLDVTKTKICAECGNSFNKADMQSYLFKKTKVNVCNNCFETLKKEGHREPKLLAAIKKPQEYKKSTSEKEQEK